MNEREPEKNKTTMEHFIVTGKFTDTAIIKTMAESRNTIKQSSKKSSHQISRFRLASSSGVCVTEISISTSIRFSALFVSSSLFIKPKLLQKVTARKYK